MSALVILAILITFAVAGPRWGVDSRRSRDANDRYWWPDG